MRSVTKLGKKNDVSLLQTKNDTATHPRVDCRKHKNEEIQRLEVG